MLDQSAPPGNPDRYQWVGLQQKAAWHGFWTADKFSFDTDLIDLKRNMTPEEIQFALRSLAAVAQIEVKVKKFWAFLGMQIKDDVITGGAITMAGLEEIHNDAYKTLFRKAMLTAIMEKALEVPAIAGRVNYLTKHSVPVYALNPAKQTAYSVILFTIFVEYVSLFVPFANILRLNAERNVLKDTARQVKYTRNEETLHAMFGAGIIHEMRKEYPELFDAELEARVREEAMEAFKAECNLIDWMFEGYDSDPDHNADVMKNYVKERFNEGLEMIGYAPIFNVDSELSAKTFWMKVGVYATPKVDFFNDDPASYTQGDTNNDDDF
ncbi:ribonucleotide-diphosphate reductase subunit beta [Paracoccus litorisediminis]|nr:ribonucleotide-diphosphate reductase subunit beta [Paracoccus litorisediminis]